MGFRPTAAPRRTLGIASNAVAVGQHTKVRHLFPVTRTATWKHVWFEEIGHTLLTVCLEGKGRLITPAAGGVSGYFRQSVTDAGTVLLAHSASRKGPGEAG